MARGSSVYTAKKATTLSNPTGTAAVFTQSDSASWSAFVGLPSTAFASGTSGLDGKVFYLRMSGLVLTGSGGTATFTPQIWFTTLARTTVAVTSATAVAGTASTALSATTTYPWFLEAEIVYSQTATSFGGYYNQFVGIASGLTTQTITTANVITGDLSVATSGFIASALMGTSRSGCVVTLSEFVAEVL